MAKKEWRKSQKAVETRKGLNLAPSTLGMILTPNVVPLEGRGRAWNSSIEFANAHLLLMQCEEEGAY